MVNLPEWNQKIPLGNWIENGIGVLTTHFEDHFRKFSESLDTFVSGIIQTFENIPPWLTISILLFAVYFIKRSWKNIIVSGLGLSLIVNLGYWKETLETIALVACATTICVFIGVPIGILCAKRKRLYQVLQPLLDLMQTIPTFVYLIPTLMLFGLGLAPGVVSTVIFAMPTTIRLTYLGIVRTPKSLIEVADAFGSNSWRKLIDVEIPYAFPNIMTGISQCVMLSLSMVVIAALVGANGLGKPVIQALNTVNISKGFEAGFVIVIVAVFLDRLLAIRVSPTSFPSGD